MTESNSLFDTSAWKTEDPDWVTARKKQWKIVKKVIQQLALADSRDLDMPFLKEFFLTGTVPLEEMRKVKGRRFDDERPLKHTVAPVLIECFLTADQSYENWERIRQKYDDKYYWVSRRRLKGLFSIYPTVGTVYGNNELERRLYRFFSPQRCRREDFPEFGDARFTSEARHINGSVWVGMSRLLKPQRPNPNNFSPLGLQEWVDSLTIAISEYDLPWDETAAELAELVFLANRDIEQSGWRAEFQVNAAKKLLSLIEVTEFPKSVTEAFEKGRKRQISGKSLNRECPFCGHIAKRSWLNAKQCPICCTDWTDSERPVCCDCKKLSVKAHED